MICWFLKEIFLRSAPEKFELSGKIELMTFVLTFLTSTWYIKNPFLKSKINDVRIAWYYKSLGEFQLIIWGFVRCFL